MTPYHPNINPKREGNTLRQAHGKIPKGAVEIEHGRDGFFGKVSHLYKSNKPTGWKSVEGPLRHRSFSFLNFQSKDMNDPNANPTVLFYNESVVIAVSRIKTEMPFYARNADGDLCIFVHRGTGHLESDYGRLEYVTGDYIIIPRGTSYRFVPSSTDNYFLYIEATDSEINFPDRGVLGPTAQIDPAMVESSTLPENPTRPNDEWEVRIKKFGEFTKVVYPFNPVEDTIGFKGDVYVWKVSIKDYQPIVSPTYHLPPSVHTTFLAKGFVICSFVPRPLEDPSVLRIPFYHSNIEYDELIFYHAGNFFSRHGIDEADITLHPPGLIHGPQNQAFDGVQNNPSKTHTNEYAVMIDSRLPLKISEEAFSAENIEYINSWKEELSNK